MLFDVDVLLSKCVYRVSRKLHWKFSLIDLAGLCLHCFVICTIRPMCNSRSGGTTGGSCYVSVWILFFSFCLYFILRVEVQFSWILHLKIVFLFYLLINELIIFSERELTFSFAICYGRLLSPGNLFVNDRCTDFILVILVIVYGDHTEVAYSSSGLT